MTSIMSQKKTEAQESKVTHEGRLHSGPMIMVKCKAFWLIDREFEEVFKTVIWEGIQKHAAKFGLCQGLCQENQAKRIEKKICS